MLEIKYININELKEYSNNAKIHTEEQITQIMNSIKEFGFNDPIALDKDNIIIEGHGRLFAAKRLKLNTIPVIYLNDLNEEQIKAYMLVHNQLTMNTGFDFGILEKELESIKNINMVNYGLKKLDDMLLDFENEETDNNNIKKNKKITCPHCGHEFTN